MNMKNWFDTLNEALESEGLLHTWDISFGGIGYGETKSYRYDNGTKYGQFISIYRDNITGKYERPIHYNC